MTKSKPYNSFLLALALSLPTALVAMTMPQQALSQEDDAYLQELDAEAKRSANVTKNKPQSKNSGSSTPSSKSEQNQIENFEKLLRFERPSTHRFFTRLTQDEKLQVIKDYDTHKKLTHSSKVIFDLYFKRN